MKRSEMLSKMINTFLTCKNQLNFSDEASMDRVLEIIEENGMLPPKTEAHIFYDVIQGSFYSTNNIKTDWDEE